MPDAKLRQESSKTMELNRGGTAKEVIREGDPKDMIDAVDVVALYSITRHEARILLCRRGENA